MLTLHDMGVKKVAIRGPPLTGQVLEATRFFVHRLVRHS